VRGAASRPCAARTTAPSPHEIRDSPLPIVSPSVRFILLALLLPAQAAVVPGLWAQGSSVPPAGSPANDGWNTPRAQELLIRAQERRALQQIDTAMLNYRADARGYVYFLLDHPESGRQNLVRTDQVAVDVYWRAPDEARQHIVGWREQKELPVSRLHYYLDRLTVVQDNYGDGIMIADGDNVNDVPHPAAPGAERIYDYRLVDSLTLRLPGAMDPVRVYELRVRPKRADEPAVIGSLFVDAGSGAVVRMDFTFTRAAYIDRRLDYINVRMENGLWQGRFWLPHEQRLEIRREVPELDFPVGTIIRTRMRVGNYRFNEEIPNALFYAPRITAAPREEREAFAFEEPIDAERRAEGIAPPLDVAELRREARQLMRRQALSGLPRSRLHLSRVSDLFRYNRAEGAVVGIGGSFAPGGGSALRLHGGYAFGAGHPLLRTELTRQHPFGFATGAAYLNQPRDVGIRPVASGTVNTFSALLAGYDFLDLHSASGVSLALQQDVGAGWAAGIATRFERHRSLDLGASFSLVEEPSFRPVREIDRGDVLTADLTLRRAGPWGSEWTWNAELATTVATLDRDVGDRRSWVQPLASADAARSFAWRGTRLEAGVSGGLTFGEIPKQALWLAGGRGTVAGHDFRAYGGDRFALGRALATADLARPWLRARTFAEAGWTDVGPPGAEALAGWGAQPTGGVITGVGAGLGIFYDLLHVDVARGLGERGRWEVTVEAQRAFWGWL
jgi:hypothetical protein